MLRYFLTRLAGAVPTLFIIVTLAFFLIRAAPGGPFDQEQALPPEIMANLQSAYGLDQPVWMQYGRYLRRPGARRFRAFVQVQGFFGDGTDRPGVSRDSRARRRSPWPWRLLLGIPIGTFAALHHNRAADYATMSLAVVGIAIPSFVVLPFLGLLFGIYLHWLPVAGWEPGSLRDLVLPVVALALPPLSVIARLTRGSMLEVLRSPFIRTALAKGLPLRTVIMRHALRPALLPVASYLAPAVASIMTGSLVVESIAGLPGIGRYMVQGALNRDYTLVMGMVIIYSTLAHRHGTASSISCTPGWIRA